MDGLSQLGGTVADEFTHEGKTYRLGILTRDDWADIERSLVQDRPHPLAAVKPHLDGLPEEQQRFLLERAYEDARLGPRLRIGELEQWLATVEGGRVRFWRAIRKHHPEIEQDEAYALFEIKVEQDYERMQQALSAANGFPEGNSSSPSQDEEKPSPGDQSTDD